VATVNAFLKELWGYDPQRIWQVRAVQKTQVPGLSRVTILVGVAGGDPKQVQGSQFFVLPDGKHAIADDVISFGAKPFAETREILKTRANGPAKGAVGKDLLFVEFSDFQCPHCKEAQTIVDHLMQDFPNGRLVYENFPLRSIHPAAEQAAEYGVCVAKTSGDAFYKYANAVFENQAGLTPEGTTQTLKDAVTKAGLSPDQIAACVAQPQTKAAVDESVKLAEDLNVNQTPTLFVNGRPVPVSASVPYETTKSMVAYQLQLDGLPQPAPKLSSLSK
jgi:protein-disulfide isomerase